MKRFVRLIRVREIAAEVNVELKQLEILLSRAAAIGLVYRIADNRYFLAETVQALAEIAAQLANEADDRMFSVKHYRDNTANGRNLAIEVLEFFDKKRNSPNVMKIREQLNAYRKKFFTGLSSNKR